jgi:competence protein ComEC
MVIYFHQFSVTSILANVFIVPPLTLAVPAGFVAALTGWAWVGWIAQVLIRFAVDAAGWWVDLEPGWRIPDPPAWAAVILGGSIGLLGVLAFRGSRTRYVLASAAVTAVACTTLLAFPFAPLIPERQLELTAIDVGQGESLLAAFPDGRIMLIDGGGIPTFDPRLKPRLEIGEDVVSPYLWQRQIRHIDIVAATHLHDDHVAGLPAVIRNFRPGEVWTGAVADSAAWRNLQEAANETGTRMVQICSPAMVRIGGVEVRALAPSPEYVSGQEPRNDDSLVLALTYGKHRFLLTGDIGPAVEDKLLASGMLDEIDVLKVAHHGGKTSTSSAFLDAVRPLFAIISAGHGNLYGHPNPAVIERLYGTGTRIFRTDVDGRTTFRTDGRRLEIETGGGSVRPALSEKL